MLQNVKTIKSSSTPQMDVYNINDNTMWWKIAIYSPSDQVSAYVLHSRVLPYLCTTDLHTSDDPDTECYSVNKPIAVAPLSGTARFISRPLNTVIRTLTAVFHQCYSVYFSGRSVAVNADVHSSLSELIYTAPNRY